MAIHSWMLDHAGEETLGRISPAAVLPRRAGRTAAGARRLASRPQRPPVPLRRHLSFVFAATTPDRRMRSSSQDSVLAHHDALIRASQPHGFGQSTNPAAENGGNRRPSRATRGSSSMNIPQIRDVSDRIQSAPRSNSGAQGRNFKSCRARSQKARLTRVFRFSAATPFRFRKVEGFAPPPGPTPAAQPLHGEPRAPRAARVACAGPPVRTLPARVGSNQGNHPGGKSRCSA